MTLGKSRKPIQRKAPLRSSGPPERRTEMPRVNRKRKAKNTLRAFGPVERRKWMKTQLCVGCGRVQGFFTNIVSAHIETGGTGRKSDARLTIALCETITKTGCHDAQHLWGWSCIKKLDTPEKREAAAARTEAAWQAHLYQQTGAGTT